MPVRVITSALLCNAYAFHASYPCPVPVIEVHLPLQPDKPLIRPEPLLDLGLAHREHGGEGQGRCPRICDVRRPRVYRINPPAYRKLLKVPVEDITPLRLDVDGLD